MPGQHALLSPSSAHRWLNCPPSAKLCAAQEETTSVYAQQGTDAHELCQHKLEKALGLDTTDPTENLTYYDEEMENCANDYASFVMETLAKIKDTCPDPVVLIEQRLDFSRFVPQGFGRGDCVIIADGTMHVIDFKYGLGVLVSAEDNPQMLCYALGALELLDSLYEFDQISMTIFQPRRDNISTFTIAKDELLVWAENTLAPTAKLAYEGKGEFKAGDHCQFCKIKATCRKRAEYNLEMARYDFEMPVNLDHIEIAAILDKADQLASWVEDVKEYALAEALRGTRFDGYKVVAGRANRKYTDESAAAAAVIAAGADPYEKKLLGITAMTALLGKKKFEEILGSLVIKPQGKPVLVKADDKRPEYNSAINDFNGSNRSRHSLELCECLGT